MKFAICVGINNYSWLGSASNLGGCIEDAKDWARLFRDFYRFDDIHLLTDAAATPHAVRSAMSRVVERAVAGDTVVFTYSGHGTRVADTDGDEPDGYDEAIVLHGSLYTDDELAGDLKMFASDIPVTVIADSCHSGTMMRLLPPTDPASDGLRPRFVDASAFKREGSPRPLRTLSHRFGAPRGDSGPRNILLAGCKATETSMDAFLDNAYHGALTYHAVRLLRENPRITWREFHRHLLTCVRRTSPQTPQLEGATAALDAPVFA